MAERFEVIVIGGGPGGLMAALTLAKARRTVLLLEKDPEIGRPVHCAEGVTRQSFGQFIDISPAWIQTTPTIGKLVSPSGHTLTMQHRFGGYILDRPRMEQDLAAQVVEHGGEVRCHWRGVQLLGSGDRFELLEAVDDHGATTNLEADLFIAADGVESTIARSAGLDTQIDIATTESYLEYRLEQIEVDSTVAEVQVGSNVAPQSYAWVFPVSNSAANVGLGVPATYGPRKPVRAYLDRFVDRRFGGGTITRVSCGAAVRYQGPEKLQKNNLLVVGDAARLLDSLTGGGIQLAMASGKAAAEAAGVYLASDRSSYQAMVQHYPTDFMRERDRELTQLRKIKELVDKLSDNELDDLVTGLAAYFGDGPAERVSAWATLAGVIRKKPRILRIARHLFQ